MQKKMAYRGNKKKGKYMQYAGKTMWTSKSLSPYGASKYEMKAVAWCLKNDIHIYIHCYEPHIMHLAIRINGKENISPETYSGDEILKKKYEFYKYYYEKYNV